MICMSALYANGPGKTFDFDYYLNKHVPLVNQRLKPLGLVRYEIDRGLGGGVPGSAPAYLCMGRLYFDTLEQFQQSLMQHGPELLADIPNFTNVEIVLQVSESL